MMGSSRGRSELTAVLATLSDPDATAERAARLRNSVQEMQAQEAKLRDAADALKAEREQHLQSRAQLSLRSQALDQRATELAEVAAGHATRAGELDAREAHVNQLFADLHSSQAELAEAARKIDQHSAAIAAREDAVAEREKLCGRREAEVAAAHKEAERVRLDYEARIDALKAVVASSPRHSGT